MNSMAGYVNGIVNWTRRNRLRDVSTSKSSTPLIPITNGFVTIAEENLNFLNVVKDGDLNQLTSALLRVSDASTIVDDQGRGFIHYGAAGNSPAVIQVILEYSKDINVQDYRLNTPLHVAVECDALKSIEYLISRGALTNILNDQFYGPLHLATVLDKPRIVRCLLSFKEVDGMARGEQGRTALHIACILDHDKCVSVMIESIKCCPKSACVNGSYALHEACKHASEKALNVLLDDANKSARINKEVVMNLHDKDGNTPLHTAVHGGNIKALELCLKNGANICTQQLDKSTPMHLACSRGSLEMVRLILDGRSESTKSRCINLVDAQNRTPLHMAAMFDCPEVVQYLVEQGSDMSCRDVKGRTPLHLAAKHKGWMASRKLIELGADLDLVNDNQENVFHLLVSNGAYLNSFKDLLMPQWDVVCRLLNDKDSDGCTPMHLSTKFGRIQSAVMLMDLGVNLSTKNKDNQAPIHFAAKYGRYNTIQKFISYCKNNLNCLNEADRYGNTPLHHAAENGHVRVISLLLSRGAAILRNYRDQTPLHVACRNGYTKCAASVLSVHSCLIDKQDLDGNTSLHLATQNNKSKTTTFLLDLNCQIIKNNKELNPMDYAIHNKHTEVLQAMVNHKIRGKELMKMAVADYENVCHALIATMPCVMSTVLDNSISRPLDMRIDSPDFYIKYNFECLEENVSVKCKNTPLPVLNKMVRYGRESLLSHDLCKKYLVHKWMNYGMYCSLWSLFFYFIYLISTTLYVFAQFDRHYNGTNSEHNKLLMSDVTICTLKSIVWVIVILNVFKEIGQFLYEDKQKYLSDPVNYFELTLYTLTVLMLVYGEQVERSKEEFTSVCAITVFLAWFISLLYLQRFNGVGLYIVMFLQILYTLLKVMSVFSIVIIAFGASFHVLLGEPTILPEEKGFFSFPLSMVRVMAMMLGEMDFIGSFIRPLINHSKLPGHFQLKISIAFFVLFAVLMPVLLMNLLIGLAVGDIEKVRRSALLKSLAMQVEIHTDMEQKLPNRVLNKVYKKEVVVYPNRKRKANTHCMHKVMGTLMASSIFEDQESKQDDRTFHFLEELEKQKKKLKEVSSTLDSQLHLVKLIVQKMEIKTEQDELDE